MPLHHEKLTQHRRPDRFINHSNMDWVIGRVAPQQHFWL
jgi:hypothetical protein